MRTHHVLAGLAILPVVLSLGACTKGEPSGGAAGGSAASGSPGKSLKIVFIPKNTGNPYFDAVSKGFEKAARERGFEFSTLGPSAADATSQIPFIKQQVQQQVSAIAISPNSPDAVRGALKEAIARGVRVVTVDADTEGFEDAREAFVQPADFGEIGKSQIELMGELTGYEGEFAILSATTDAPNQNAWIAGMKEALKDPKYAKMKLVEIAYGNDDPQKSLTESQALLTKHPNLRGILAPTSVGVVAAAQAVETAKAAERVSVTGLGTPNQMRRFVEEGIVKKFQLWDPADAGYLAGHLLVDLIEGKVKAQPGGKFTAGTLGERAFKEKNVTIGGPLVTFDKSNIGEYRF